MPGTEAGMDDRACSNDPRERAMARVVAGESIRAIAAALAISPSSVEMVASAERDRERFAKTVLARSRRALTSPRRRAGKPTRAGSTQRLVFIDETWVKTNMAPLRGWGPRGRRLKAYALRPLENPDLHRRPAP